MLLWMRSFSWMRTETLMVRSRALRTVSNHEASDGVVYFA
jgi:hypothetical protein